MNYIQEELVKEFINRLPPLEKPNNTHLQMLAARSRKCREIMGFKIKDLVMERKIIRAIPEWKTRYFDSIYNLAVLQNHGRYTVNDVYVPTEAFGILATISPRNVTSATEEIMKEQTELIFKTLKDQQSYLLLGKINSRFFASLHRHHDRTWNFVTLDLDVSTKEIYEDIHDIISPLKIWMITETSRGYHFILDLKHVDDAKTFYGYGKRPQDGIIYKLKSKYCKESLKNNTKVDGCVNCWNASNSVSTDVLHIQKDSQEPVVGTMYSRNKGEPYYVQIIE